MYQWFVIVTYADGSQQRLCYPNEMEAHEGWLKQHELAQLAIPKDQRPRIGLRIAVINKPVREFIADGRRRQKDPVYTKKGLIV